MHININKIPLYVKEIAHKLQENGFEAYIVGGCVRDLLLDKTPKDYDITTNALPEQLINIFPESILTGMKFGTVKVLINDEKSSKTVVDVTTYRSEEDYVKGRWPSKIEFSKNISDDLSRRDFTINAMAINLHDDSMDILDLFGGLNDLKNKLIKAVGNPIDRFNEDGLRPFRACRLASVLEFDIEEETFKAISQSIDVAKQISMERVRIEFVRLIEESPRPSIGIELLRKSSLLNIFIPELLEGYGMIQNKYHKFDVYQHLIHCMDIAPKDIRLAALFHDIGKPRKKSGEHFYGHDIEGAKMVKEIMQRLKFSSSQIDEVSRLVRWHMFFYPENKQEISSRIEKEQDPNIDNDLIETERKELRNKRLNEGWSDNAVKRFIRNVGGDEMIEKLFELRIADGISTNPDKEFNINDIKRLQQRISEVRAQEGAIQLKDLAINGSDLLKLGIPEGPKIKNILDDLLEEVIDDPEKNSPEYLITRSRHLYSA